MGECEGGGDGEDEGEGEGGGGAAGERANSRTRVCVGRGAGSGRVTDRTILSCWALLKIAKPSSGLSKTPLSSSAWSRKKVGGNHAAVK